MPLPKAEFLSFMETVAPARLCESWDNCGMLLDTGKTAFSRVLLALDATEAVAHEAVELGCDLLLTHHPILLKGIHRIAQNDPQGRVITTLLRGGVSHFAAHTNLDSAKSGVNAVLAKKIGLQNVQVLHTSSLDAKKIIVYVPRSHVHTVFEAMAQAGAGKFGNYRKCSFQSDGMGTFEPVEGAEPFIGKVGSLESVEEIRLETFVPKEKLRRVISAMLAAHPYEEPAFDVFTTELQSLDEGLGRIGDLENTLTFGCFAQQVKQILNINSVTVAGDLNLFVQRIAVCGGSGSEFIDEAIRQKADVFVTGDLKHHQILDGIEKGILLLDATHFATEAPIINELFECLQEQFDKVQYEIDFFISRAGVSAIQSI